MQNIYVKDIINLCQGKLLIGSSTTICQNFSKDTRELKEGDTYIGIKGENFDGNTFYQEAFDKGANVCILEYCNLTEQDKQKYQDKTIIIVDNTIETIQTLANYKRNMYDIPVIAITGSVGKTSTKDIVASVLSQKYKVLKTEGNQNNHIGLPLTILKLKDHECLVIEMGMNHFKEISKLTTIARPNYAIITNIGTAHIGNLGTRENILKAKLEILEGLSPDGKLIINNDDELLNEYYKRSPIQNQIITIGINNASTYHATSVEETTTGSTYTIDNHNITVPLPGKPFIYNSLIAYAIGDILHLSKDQIQNGIQSVQLSDHRLQTTVTKNNITIIDDTYNSSYDSVKGAIELLNNDDHKRHILVLGDMLELGTHAKDIHYQVGLLINAHINTLITVGELSENIAEGAISKGFPKENIYKFSNHEEVTNFLKTYLASNDLILLKGSHAMKLSNTVDTLIKYYQDH